MRGFNYFKHMVKTLTRWREIVCEGEGDGSKEKQEAVDCIDMAIFNVGLVDDFVKNSDDREMWENYDGYTVAEAPKNWLETMSSYETAVLSSWGFENTKRVGVKRSTKLKIDEKNMKPYEIADIKKKNHKLTMADLKATLLSPCKNRSFKFRDRGVYLWWGVLSRKTVGKLATAALSCVKEIKSFDDLVTYATVLSLTSKTPLRRGELLRGSKNSRYLQGLQRIAWGRICAAWL